MRASAMKKRPLFETLSNRQKELLELLAACLKMCGKMELITHDQYLRLMQEAEMSPERMERILCSLPKNVQCELIRMHRLEHLLFPGNPLPV